MRKEKAGDAVSGGFGKAKTAHRSRVVATRVAYAGKRFNVYTDTVIEPDGMEHVREVIRRYGSIAVLAVDETRDAADPDVILERQWRHAPGRFLIELPAGAIEEGETPLAAAKREMAEETGFRARRWTLLTKYYASPGFVGEVMQIYLAREIREGKARPEPYEHIEIRRVRLSEAMRMVGNGEIVDGKTMIGLMLYAAGRRDGIVAAKSRSSRAAEG